MSDTRELTQRDPVVVLAADEAFSMPLAVTVRSALDNLAADRVLQIYVLDGGISPATKERILRSWPQTDRYNVRWIPIDESSLAGLEVSGHVSLAAYYRILMPRVLPQDVKRVLYLDSDLLVMRDLGALWDCDMGVNLCMAVQEFIAPYLDSAILSNYDRAHPFLIRSPIPNYQSLGLAPELPYFNSGILLIDLDAWRKLDLANQLIQCLRVHREHVVWWDQYALNVILARRWGLLNPRWNQAAQIYRFPAWNFTHVGKELFQSVLKAPHIVHFNTPEKPWHVDSHHPFRKEFFIYLDRTDWAGWRPADDKSWPTWLKYQTGRLRTTAENVKHRIIGRLRDVRNFVRARNA